jgi:hypothetical protein
MLTCLDVLCGGKLARMAPAAAAAEPATAVSTMSVAQRAKKRLWPE